MWSSAVWADGLSGTAGWTFQLDAGSGYITRLSELTGANHNWQLYHYDLQSSELVSNLKMRFQFRGGQNTCRIDLDQIAVQVITGAGAVPLMFSCWTMACTRTVRRVMHVYGGQIPAMAAGRRELLPHRHRRAGSSTTNPAGAPGDHFLLHGPKRVHELQTVGLFLNTTNAWPGYTLMAPMHHTNTYLLNNAGEIVHRWTSAYEPGRTAYLLTNGHLFRAGMVRSGGPSTGGGEGGRIEEYDWDGNLVWAIDYYSPTYIHHHDFKVLPNGNVLLLVAEKKTYAEVHRRRLQPEACWIPASPARATCCPTPSSK